MFIRLLFTLPLILLHGCASYHPVKPDDPRYAPVVAPQPTAERPTTGSLFRSNYGMSLFEDNRAANIGDIITVVLQERTVSSKSATVDVTKESDTQFGGGANGRGTVLGVDPTLGNYSMSTAVTQDREFSGDSSADQSNSLEGNITVTVVEKMPNGNLMVTGEKWMTLNRGEEFIRISGIIRPDDVSDDNTIASTRLANARITYSGTGELANSQEMGWMSKFFNSPVWPF